VWRCNSDVWDANWVGFGSEFFICNGLGRVQLKIDVLFIRYWFIYYVLLNCNSKQTQTHACIEDGTVSMCTDMYTDDYQFILSSNGRRSSQGHVCGCSDRTQYCWCVRKPDWLFAPLWVPASSSWLLLARLHID